MMDGSCAATLMSADEWRTFQQVSNSNPDCRFEYIGRPLLRLSAGFALKEDISNCVSILRVALDVHLQAMTIDGTIERIWAKYIKDNSDQALFFLVFLASIAGLVTSHWGYWYNKAVPPDDNPTEDSEPEDLAASVARLTKEQAESNARFQKALAIIATLQSKGGSGVTPISPGRAKRDFEMQNSRYPGIITPAPSSSMEAIHYPARVGPVLLNAGPGAFS
eukprot:Tamp_14053.p1 GENE.Tamp_14053~~Tamp_14053.p1  ORF type:complete len:221 (-),score=34.50 Tamp_14053:452-1114(-)